jgi:hypothetical protein
MSGGLQLCGEHVNSAVFGARGGQCDGEGRASTELTFDIDPAALGFRRRSTARTRNTSSRGLKGLVT